MPSNGAPPVLHEWRGWSPYQQHTSVARVIESPIDAMLLGGLGRAVAVGAAARTATTTAGKKYLRTMSPFVVRRPAVPRRPRFRHRPRPSIAPYRCGCPELAQEVSTE